MKTRNFIQRIRLLTIVFTSLVFMSISCTAQHSKQDVLDTYQLRMNGHADSAQVLLKIITEENPNDALAWFELCRTTHHIGMANPRAIKESLEEALGYINTACNVDNKNPKYLAYKGRLETLKYYMALQMGGKDATDLLLNIEKTYLTVLELDPTYYEVKITLVEFFGGLPAEMGGDLTKAEQYTSELELANNIAGAKAREILMSEDADYVAFWNSIILENPENTDAHQALGRVYLFNGDFKQAEKQYKKAIQLDANKNALYLDLGRYFVMQAMQNQDILDSLAPLAEEQFNKYLNANPKPVQPMRAWTYGSMAMIARRAGNKEQAAKNLEMAKELDPFFTPAFGKPYGGLFTPPEEIIHFQTYYLSPF